MSVDDRLKEIEARLDRIEWRRAEEDKVSLPSDIRPIGCICHRGGANPYCNVHYPRTTAEARAQPLGAQG